MDNVAVSRIWNRKYAQMALSAYSRDTHLSMDTECRYWLTQRDCGFFQQVAGVLIIAARDATSGLAP